MDPYFDQKTFLVTGGASGIGRETARMLVARGAAVSIADRDVHELENTAAAISKEFPGARILTTKLDVRDPSAANEWIARTESQLGNVYGCVNAAGISPPSHLRLTIEETPIEEWDNTIGVNLTGVMICMREEVRAMKKSGVRGSIVNIASAAGLVGIERGSPYSVSKWGVIGLTRSVAKETAKYGIRVTGVAPGWTMTPMLENVDSREVLKTFTDATPIQRAGRPEEIVELILFLLSDKSSFMTGSIHSVDGGATA